MGLLKSIKNAVLGLKDIEVTGRMRVSTLQAQFKEQFGTGIRVYKLNSAGQISSGRGARLAEPSATLASVSAGKVGTITLKKNMTVKEAEDAFAEKLGVGVQIEDKDGALANNQVRLADLAK